MSIDLNKNKREAQSEAQQAAVINEPIEETTQQEDDTNGYNPNKSFAVTPALFIGSEAFLDKAVNVPKGGTITKDTPREPIMNKAGDTQYVQLKVDGAAFNNPDVKVGYINVATSCCRFEGNKVRIKTLPGAEFKAKVQMQDGTWKNSKDSGITITTEQLSDYVVDKRKAYMEEKGITNDKPYNEKKPTKESFMTKRMFVGGANGQVFFTKNDKDGNRVPITDANGNRYVQVKLPAPDTAEFKDVDNLYFNISENQVSLNRLADKDGKFPKGTTARLDLNPDAKIKCSAKMKDGEFKNHEKCGITITPETINQCIDYRNEQYRAQAKTAQRAEASAEVGATIEASVDAEREVPFS